MLVYKCCKDDNASHWTKYKNLSHPYALTSSLIITIIYVVESFIQIQSGLLHPFMMLLATA